MFVGSWDEIQYLNVKFALNDLTDKEEMYTLE